MDFGGGGGSEHLNTEYNFISSRMHLTLFEIASCEAYSSREPSMTSRFFGLLILNGFSAYLSSSSVDFKILPTVARPILNCFAIELAEEPSVEVLMTCNFSANVNSFCFDDFCADGDGFQAFWRQSSKTIMQN